MKVYEVQLQVSNGVWNRVGILKTKAAAIKYMNSFNTKIEVYPTRVVEIKVLNMKDIKDDLQA